MVRKVVRTLKRGRDLVVYSAQTRAARWAREGWEASRPA